MKEGRTPVLDVERQGVLALKQSIPKAHFLYFKPPSLEALKVRLKGRGTESDDSMQKRIETAERDMQWADENLHLFDKVIVNDDLEQAYAELNAFLFK